MGIGQERLKRAQAECFMLDFDDEAVPLQLVQRDAFLDDQVFNDVADFTVQLDAPQEVELGQIEALDQAPVNTAFEILEKLLVLDGARLAERVVRGHDQPS